MKKLAPLVAVLTLFTALVWTLGFVAGKHITDKAGTNLTVAAGRSTGFGSHSGFYWDGTGVVFASNGERRARFLQPPLKSVPIPDPVEPKSK